MVQISYSVCHICNIHQILALAFAAKISVAQTLGLGAEVSVTSSFLDPRTPPGLFPDFMPSSHPIPQSQHYPTPLGQREPLLSDPPSQLPGSGCPGAGSISLAEVHRELQTLQMQLADRERTSLRCVRVRECVSKARIILAHIVLIAY